MRRRLLTLLERLRAANELVGRVMNDAAGWLFVVCALFVSFAVPVQITRHGDAAYFAGYALS